jgi:hypothetical protein
VEVKLAVRSETEKVKLATGGSAKAGLTGNVAREQKKSAKNITILVFI